MKEKSCYNCRFYNVQSFICLHDFIKMAIINESQSAKNCEYYSEGKFDWNALEASDYR